MKRRVCPTLEAPAYSDGAQAKLLPSPGNTREGLVVGSCCQNSLSAGRTAVEKRGRLPRSHMLFLI